MKPWYYFYNLSISNNKKKLIYSLSNKLRSQL